MQVSLLYSVVQVVHHIESIESDGTYHKETLHRNRLEVLSSFTTTDDISFLTQPFICTETHLNSSLFTTNKTWCNFQQCF